MSSQTKEVILEGIKPGILFRLYERGEEIGVNRSVAELCKGGRRGFSLFWKNVE